MRIEIGSGNKVVGVVEHNIYGLTLYGDTDKVRNLLESMRGDLSDAELIASLPVRLYGRTWAREIK